MTTIVITDASSSRYVRNATSGVCELVRLCECLRCKRKTIRTINTKLGKHNALWHDLGIH